MIPESFINELKYHSDIEKIVSSYVNLKRGGRILTGLCPFHSEKSPSFTVYPDSQSFYCFGCGAGGDVVTFIKKIENLEYVEALKFLAERAGLKMPEQEQDDKTAALKMRILELNREAARFFHNCLMSPAGARALEYIHGRALTDKTIRKFGLGYAPDSWNALTNHLKAKGFTENEMLAAAVAAKGRNNGFYDMFRNRIIFPIIDLRGNVIAFGGRVMDDSKPKYLNSGDTPVFKKSKNLFAMNIAKSVKSDSIILCEGYMDVIALHQAGFENTVATLGTALAAEQSHLISQYCSQVILSYDSDAAGQQAAKKAINLFAQTGVKVKVLTVKGAKDPDEFIKKYGRERFKMLIDGCENAIEYEISKIKDKYNMETADGKVSFLKEFCALMSQINSPIEREIYISRYALELEIDKAAVAAQVQSLFKKRVKAQQAKQERSLNIFVNSTPDKQKDFERSKNLQCALAEDKLITALIKNPDYYKYILSKISSRDFITTRNREIFEILCQRLENSLSIELFELSSVLDDNAMSAIAFLVASSNGISYSRADVDEYISILLQNKSKKSESEIAQMSDDELMSFIGSLSRK